MRRGCHAAVWLFLVLAALPLKAAGSGGVSSDAGAVDLVIVLDRSASMRSNDPGRLVGRALTDLVLTMRDVDRVALVTFDSDARLMQPLTSMGTPSSRSALTAAVDAVTFEGRWTSIADGVERALYELKGRGRPTAARVLVLITDGIIDTGDATRDVQRTAWLTDSLFHDCRTNDVRIIGVAFSETADYQLLQRAAAETGGAYYRVLRDDAISGVLAGLRDSLLAKAAPESQQMAGAQTGPLATPRPAASAPAASPETTRPVAAARTTGSLLSRALVGLFVAAAVLAAAWLLVRRRGPASAPDGNRAPVTATGAVQGAAPVGPFAHLEDLDSGARLVLDKPITRLGRRAECDVVIDDPMISGFHSQIELRSGVHYLIDLRSTNGTFLNDRKVEGEQVLRDGDVIRLDKRAHVFLVGSHVAPTEIAGARMRTQVRAAVEAPAVLQSPPEGGEI